MGDSIQARLYARLEERPEGRALAVYGPRQGFSWRTMQELHDQASRSALALAERGLGRDDVCILVLPSSELCARLVLSVLLLAAAPLLVAPPVFQGANSSLMQVLRHTIERTRARLVVLSESLAGVREELEQHFPGTRFVFGEGDLAGVASGGSLPNVRPDESERAALQLTSGTTGLPRICVWRQEGVLAALDGMEGAMRLGREDVCLNWTPLYHDMGLVNNLLLCLTKDVPLVMMSPFDFVKDPAIWLRALTETGATTTWSPNFGFAITAQRARPEHLEGVRLEGVRAFWNAAERIHLETMRVFRERFEPYGLDPEALKTNFGCAENVGGATFSDPDGSFVVEWVDRVRLQDERMAVPVGEGDPRGVAIVGVGRPYPGMRITILSSEEGRPLPDGQVGEVGLATPSRMEAYLGDEEATRQAIQGEYLITGDLGYLREGELFWVGRSRERINVRGKKLDPSDFEPVLLGIPDLREGCFAAFGIDDTQRGTQKIVVVSEVRDGAARDGEELAGEIRRRAFGELGVNVDEVVLVRQGTLTKTSSGKRRHLFFRQMYLEGGLQKFIPEADGPARRGR